MAGLPPLLPTPPASLKLRDTAVESRAPKRHRPPEPPASDSRRPQPNSPPSSRRRTRELPPRPSKVRRRSRSPPPSKLRRRSRSPSLSELRRRSRSPPPSKVWHRSRSPLYVSVTQQLVELQRANPLAEGERSRPSSPDESLVENRLSRHCSCKHPETSSATVANRPDPAIRGHEQKLDSKKMDGKNQSDDKAPSRSARRKKMKRQIRAEAKKEYREAPSRSARLKKMRRQVWTEAKKQMREMKKDKLLEKIKKLQDCVWLLEKDGADKAEIMEFRSLIESTKQQYEENEELLAQAGSSASQQVLNNDRLEKTHVETMAAPVETVSKTNSRNPDEGSG